VRSTVNLPDVRIASTSSVEVLGVRVHRLTLAETVVRVRELIDAGGVHHVATVNGAMLVAAARDASVKTLLNSATLCIPDGMGVLLAGRLLGVRFPERVAGIDLVGQLCSVAAQESYRVYLFGAAAGVPEAAASALTARYPGLQIAGVHHGYLQGGEEAAVLAQIQAARPHLLFVALGAPRQEAWIAAHRATLPPAVCIGVGGTFDILAGRRRRAPVWMQRAGLEWVYRGVREPKRWRVIATLPLLVWFALKARVAKWLSRAG